MEVVVKEDQKLGKQKEGDVPTGATFHLKRDRTLIQKTQNENQSQAAGCCVVRQIKRHGARKHPIWKSSLSC
jgi:hypothetical protein